MVAVTFVGATAVSKVTVQSAAVVVPGTRTLSMVISAAVAPVVSVIELSTISLPLSATGKTTVRNCSGSPSVKRFWVVVATRAAGAVACSTYAPPSTFVTTRPSASAFATNPAAGSICSARPRAMSLGSWSEAWTV